MLGLIFPPSIFFLEFKTRQELLSMPMTLEEYEQDLAEEQAEEAENEQENEGFRTSRAVADENHGIELRYVHCIPHNLYHAICQMLSSDFEETIGR